MKKEKEQIIECDICKKTIPEFQRNDICDSCKSKTESKNLGDWTHKENWAGHIIFGSLMSIATLAILLIILKLNGTII